MEEQKQILKGLSKSKWANPNSFNATTSIIAFLVVVACTPFLLLAFEPLIVKLQEFGCGIGVIICISAVISQAYVFLIAFLFCKIKKVSLFGGRARVKFDFKSCVPALALSIGTFLFVMPVHIQFADNFSEIQKSLFGVSDLDSLLTNFSSWDVISILIYTFILAPILPAICEEALFRGVIFDGLREFGDLFAIIISGLLFALMHGSYSQLILQFILGCEIAFVVIITGNYFAGIIMHFTNNLFATFYSIIIALATTINPNGGILVESISILFGIALVCLAIAYYCNLSNFKNGKKVKLSLVYAFFKPAEENLPCCLLQKGAPIEYHFAVKYDKVIKNDNSNFLFFNGKRFSEFTKESSKTAFWIIFGLSLAVSVGLIFIDFFAVG